MSKFGGALLRVVVVKEYEKVDKNPPLLQQSLVSYNSEVSVSCRVCFSNQRQTVLNHRCSSTVEDFFLKSCILVRSIQKLVSCTLVTGCLFWNILYSIDFLLSISDQGKRFFSGVLLCWRRYNYVNFFFWTNGIGLYQSWWYWCLLLPIVNWRWNSYVLWCDEDLAKLCHANKELLILVENLRRILF